MQWAIKFLVFCFIFKLIKRVFSYFFLSFLISYSALISAILSLKYSFGSWDINVITILRISSYYKFLDTLWAFHSEFVDFRRMEVTDPRFDSVKSDSFCYHVLTALASYMKRSFVSNFTTTDSLAFDDFKRFLMWSLTLFCRYVLRVIIFLHVKVICSSCGKSTHWIIL